MYWCDRYGDAADCKSGLKRFAGPGASSTPSSPTSQAMGVTLKKYRFVVPIDASQSISKFWFVVDYGNGTTTVADNGGSDYVVDQDDVLWVPSMSKAKSVLTGANGVFVTAAVSPSVPTCIDTAHLPAGKNDELPVAGVHRLFWARDSRLHPGERNVRPCVE
jgi:hypothetical protein